MTLRIRIPLLVDLSVLDRAARILELDNRPQVTREPRGAASVVGRWLTGRVHQRLRVGNTMLPTFLDRDAPGRAAAAAELEQRLAQIDLGSLTFRGDVAQLASYVAGRTGVAHDVLAQQVVGKWFDPGFRASRTSYRDARLVARWVSKPSPYTLLMQLSGELDRAWARLEQLCRQDRMMLHGTVLALPNLVDALQGMRELFEKRPGEDVHAMMQHCLAGPPRLMRVVRAPVEGDAGQLRLRKGEVLLYDMKTARSYEPGVDVFMRGQWNQCPAHGLIPKLLGAVWKRAQHDRRRPQTLRFVQSASAQPARTLNSSAYSELTPGNLETLKQWELDQLYTQLEAGPIPDGPYEGRFFFPEGAGLRSFAEAVPGLGVQLAGLGLRRVEQLGGLLWKGKVFFAQQGLLRNIIENAERVVPLFGVHPSALRHTEVDGREVALMFPARLGYGQSLSDPARQSIIIDYDDGARIEGYLPRVDFLAARSGLRIRDEIRRIRPGLYLGYAYTDQRLLLMFTLYSARAEVQGEQPGPKGNGGTKHVTSPASLAE